jgi:hypothetical protein
MNDPKSRAKRTKLALLTQKMRDLTPQTTSESLEVDPLAIGNSYNCNKTNIG